MEKNRNRTNITSIALILTLTFSAIIVALPIASAHDPGWEVPTWTYVAVRNDPIGVNQEQLIVFWSNTVPPTAEGAYGDRWTFTVEVTKPDGSKETLGPFTSDPIGSGYTLYTPTQVGTYTIVAKMAEHVITGLPLRPDGTTSSPASVGDIYLGETSNPVTFIVQEDSIEPWSESPLPTEYWTRPIISANRDWYVLAGNWLGAQWQTNGPTIRFSYGLGPESAHIMWTTPMWAGGIMDERFGDIGYQTGHYEGIDFNPPVILNGKIYYNVYSLPRIGWYCLDLYTGETDYFHNTTGPVIGVSPSSSGTISGGKLSFGQILDIENPNQHGGMPYLWSIPGRGDPPNTPWTMYDAYTGNYICSIANASSSGTGVYGKDGSILYYNIAKGRLTCWNTTQAIWWRGTQQQYQAGDYSEFPSNSYWMWRPGLNVTYDGSHGYSLNVSIPDVSGSIVTVREDQFVIGGTTGKNNGTYIEKGNIWALSLKPGQEGTLLWNITFTPPEGPPDMITGRYAGVGGFQVDPEDGVFLFSSKQTMQRWGYSLATGAMLWGPTDPEPAFNFYSMDYDMFGTRSYIYNGMLLSVGYGGVLIAYNITTGDILWKYTAQGVGFESPYGNYPLNIAAIADGKLYVITGEHSITQPMWRGFLRCINASNGVELWKILQFGADGGANLSGMTVFMADGYVVGLNYYDNQIYCYGKGPSETTVTAAPKVTALGSSIVVEGTVTDQSAGTKQLEQASRFPNGVPAVADEFQEGWMEYVYMQQGRPQNVEGVEVVLTTYDPNGNTYEIGRTTSSDRGTFGCEVDLPVPGLYKIIATFEGSDSYYASSAETYVSVTEAPSPAQPIEPEQPAAPAPTQPEPATPAPTEPTPTEPEPTTPEPTTPEPTEPTAETPLITTEVAIIAVVAVACIIGVVAFWALRKRK
jgi:hypothetical protein